MSNLTNNRIDIIMSNEQVEAVKNAFKTIQNNMPFLVGLSVDERISLPKINVSNKAFTEDAINAVVNNAELLPGYIKVEAMKNDLALFSQLDELAGLARQLVEKIEDTQMLAGSEAYVSALVAYKLFGAAAESGLMGSDAIYDSLKTRFSISTSGTAATKSEEPTV
jgi:hypothetical protein